jgi:hypothetical protein
MTPSGLGRASVFASVFSCVFEVSALAVRTTGGLAIRHAGGRNPVPAQPRLKSHANAYGNKTIFFGMMISSAVKEQGSGTNGVQYSKPPRR